MPPSLKNTLVASVNRHRHWLGFPAESVLVPPVQRLVPTVLLLFHASLLAYGASVQSPTLNEPGHLVAGIANWRFGRFELYSVNPPLVRMVAALPVLMAGPKTDWRRYRQEPGARPEFRLGSDFVAANGTRSIWLFTLARWACIPFSVFGGYVCFRWARELYGPAAGLLALSLWCFCPNILAHGQLITPDTAATSLAAAAGYTFWRWLKRPTWRHTLVSGLVLGMAELAKTTLVVFYPLWPIMWFVYRWPEFRDMRSRDWLREMAMLAVRMLVGLYVLNLGYGFEGTFTRLGDFRFVSDSLRATQAVEEAPSDGSNRFVGTWLASVPVPLPKHYMLGIDLQKRDFENSNRPSYLRGHFRAKGWWYYYLYALAIKVPLGTWLLIVLGATGRTCTKAATAWRDELIVLGPAFIILTFVSSQTGFSEHMRYVLPVFPYVFVWTTRVVISVGREHPIRTGLMTIAMAWSIGSSLLVYPHTLSYFNEIVGGPRGGPAHLIHSNVDWGQDVLVLKRWLDLHPEAKPLNLVYFGYCDPRDFGIEYSVPKKFFMDETERLRPDAIPPGWYAVSVNYVRGFPWPAYKGDGSESYIGRDRLVAFQELEPVATAGYSIYIYHVTGERAIEHGQVVSPEDG